ncbi:VOC family protein [Oceanobacillus saliphilus]|uniref:VOC family protein n=1 Tax=Oceanobacillus saliphilus TaxID=2925834 RepID=UPI00201E531E
MDDINLLNHIGIVVRNIDEMIKKYQRIFDIKVDGPIVMEKFQVKVAYIVFKNIELELIQPLKKKGDFYHFLEEMGGLHHISVEIEDVYQIMELLKKQDVKLNSDKPLEGARNSLMVFGNKESLNGVTVEFKQLRR